MLQGVQGAWCVGAHLLCLLQPVEQRLVLLPLGMQPSLEQVLRKLSVQEDKGRDRHQHGQKQLSV